MTLEELKKKAVLFATLVEDFEREHSVYVGFIYGGAVMENMPLLAGDEFISTEVLF